MIRAIWMHIVQARAGAAKVSTLEEFLQPCAVLANLESYFRQFVMCAVDGLRLQGMYIKLSEDEISKFITDWRLQFGGKPGPVVGTQVADVIIHIWKMKMDEFEQEVEKDATKRTPHPTAERLCPPELRACLKDRARVDRTKTPNGRAGATNFSMILRQFAWEAAGAEGDINLLRHLREDRPTGVLAEDGDRHPPHELRTRLLPP